MEDAENDSEMEEDDLLATTPDHRKRRRKKEGEEKEGKTGNDEAETGNDEADRQVTMGSMEDVEIDSEMEEKDLRAATTEHHKKRRRKEKRTLNHITISIKKDCC